jgi:hypothetical protein
LSTSLPEPEPGEPDPEALRGAAPPDGGAALARGGAPPAPGGHPAPQRTALLHALHVELRVHHVDLAGVRYDGGGVAALPQLQDPVDPAAAAAMITTDFGS